MGAAIEALYYSDCCGADEGILSFSDDEPAIPPRPTLNLKQLTERALKNVYEGLEGRIEAATWEAAAETMLAAVEAGISFDYNSPNLPLALKLGQSGLWFAARRSYAQADELAQLLEKNGTKRSFSEFKKLAKPIAGKYNNRWLQTEYTTAVRSARMATIWEGMKRTQDLYPNAEYIRSRAAHPRESHLKYVGIIRPLSDPWWHSHTPPLDWNCMCSVRPSNKEATNLPADLPAPKAGLGNNSAIDQTLFSENHPYVEKAKKVEVELKKEFYDLRGKMGQYFKVRTPKGELILIHPSHPIRDIPDNLPIAAELSEMGEKVILPAKPRPDKRDFDFVINNIFSDLKTPGTGASKSKEPYTLFHEYNRDCNDKAKSVGVEKCIALVDIRQEARFVLNDFVRGLPGAFYRTEKGEKVNAAKRVIEIWIIDFNNVIHKFTREQVQNGQYREGIKSIVLYNDQRQL